MLKEAYLVNEKLKTKWFTKIESILTQIDEAQLINSSEIIAVSKLNIINEKVKKMFRQKWECDTKDDNRPANNGKNKLRTYRIFKNDIELEHYLTIIKNIDLKDSLAKFRL